MTETEEKNEMTSLSPSDKKKKDTEFQVQKESFFLSSYGFVSERGHLMHMHGRPYREIPSL